MTDEIMEKLFIERNHFRPFEVGQDNAPTGSRVGGAAPANLERSPPVCPICAGPVQYILTLASDLLGEPVARGKVVSLLACTDFRCLQESSSLIEPSSLLFLVHDDVPRAAPGGSLKSELEGRRLVAGPLQEGSPTCDDSCVGGKPEYIQPDSGRTEEEKAKAMGAGFLFQWAETSCPNDMEIGTYPFGFGAVYVFAKLDPDTGLPQLEGLMGFWQNS